MSLSQIIVESLSLKPGDIIIVTGEGSGLIAEELAQLKDMGFPKIPIIPLKPGQTIDRVDREVLEQALKIVAREA